MFRRKLKPKRKVQIVAVRDDLIYIEVSFTGLSNDIEPLLKSLFRDEEGQFRYSSMSAGLDRSTELPSTFRGEISAGFKTKAEAVSWIAMVSNNVMALQDKADKHLEEFRSLEGETEII